MPPTSPGSRWPLTRTGLALGADYNPEQWPEAVWTEDMELMREAGVDLVTVGVFSWALLEPERGVYSFAWLDRVLDRLHDAGVGVDLATATASPPPWLTHAHPEMLPVTRDGRTLSAGGRQGFCPSSPVYRERALALVAALANRYAGHPALRLWHVDNEMGGHNARCYCDVSAVAFRSWLARRYETLKALNAAWGTAVWSQHYTDWAQILPPRSAPTASNPTQLLDFARFSSDAVLDTFRAQRDVLHHLSPGIPVTTNFVVADFNDLDYWDWSAEVDVVANDHYLNGVDPAGHVDLALSADLTRGLAQGRPWLLTEHSTSAVNWQARNLAKAPGQLVRNSLQHVARGADATLFFQWRASRVGTEKFHSALVSHAGTDSKIWRDVLRLGRILDRLAEVQGSRLTADLAIVWDWPALWASELDGHPSVDVVYTDLVRRLYRPLWDRGVTVDFVPAGGDLSRFRVVLVPALYLVSDAAAENITRFVADGGTALITFWSGIVDEHDHVRLGGYPGAFRELLGIRTEEFFPLAAGGTVQLDDGSTGDVWTEWLHLDGAEAEARYVDGPLPGVPAVTRHAYGAGTAWYVATRLQRPDLDRLFDRILEASRIEPVVPVQPGVEVTRRSHGSTSYLFVLNHTLETAEVIATGVELIAGVDVAGLLQVEPGGCAVVREA